MNTPFVRRIREEGQEEGRIEGRTEGRIEGEKIGLQVGMLLGRRRSILDLLVLRFDPPASLYQQIERRLETVTDEDHYRLLLEALVRTESAAVFRTIVQDAVPGHSKASTWS